jgi:Ca-activated chloride channel family protein
MEHITFEYPYVFLLIIIFILGAKYLPLRAQSIIMPHLNIIKKLTNANSTLLSTLKWVGIILAIVALASPIKKDNITHNNKKGYNIALVLDASASMREIGFDINNRNLDKFSIVKNIVNDFIDKRENDNIAVVVFGTFSFVALPLTYDKGVIKEITIYLELGMAGDNTAIYDGLAQAIKILSNNNEAHNSVAILLTDGRNTAGNIPKEVVQKMANKHDIKVHTIGIGHEGDFNKYTLKKIAENSNGEFFEANNKDMLQDVYEQINKLEKSEIKTSHYVKKEYLFQYPLIVSILSLILFVYLRNKKGL